MGGNQKKYNVQVNDYNPDLNPSFLLNKSF